MPTYKNYYLNIEPDGTFRSEMKKLTAFIPVSERDQVYFIDSGEYSPDWYLQSNLLPAKRLFVATDRFVRIIPGLNKEYMDYFENKPPLWIGLSYNLIDAPKNPLNDVLKTKYKFVAKNRFDIFLYELDK